MEEDNFTEFLKLHGTMKFFYVFAERMSINVRLKNQKELQKKIDKLEEEEKQAEEQAENENLDDGDDIVDSCITNVKKWYKTCKTAVKKPFKIKQKWNGDSDRNCGENCDEDCDGDCDDDYFTAVYRHDRKDFFFKPKDEENFFKDCERIRMVAYALQQIDVDITGLIATSATGV